jgi:hypothetical protein
LGVLELGAGNGDASDLGAAIGGQHAGGGAVAAADIADSGATPDPTAVGYVADELEGGFVMAFVATQPEAVMDVVTPDVAVELVELVVMAGDD